MAVANAPGKAPEWGSAGRTPPVPSRPTPHFAFRRTGVCQIENGDVTFITIYKAGIDGAVPTNVALKNTYRAPSTGPELQCTGARRSLRVLPMDPRVRDNLLPSLTTSGPRRVSTRPLVRFFPFTSSINVQTEQ